jgi:hypothetical protein
MRSKDEAGAPREHRYYKRVIRRATTICGGVTVAVNLFLPVVPSGATSANQIVPDAKPPTANATSASYERVWMVPVASTSPMAMAMAPAAVILAGENRPLEARSLENGGIIWTSSVTIGTEPAIGDGRIFGVGERQLHAVSLDRGEPVWTAALDGASTGPMVDADMVVVAAGEELRAYRTSDGGALWRRTLGAAALHRPLPAGSLVVVTLAGNQLAAFDRQTGNPAWHAQLDSTPGPAAASRDRLLFGTEAGICAVHLRNGRIAWCFRTAPVPAAGAALIDGASAYFALRDNTLRRLSRGGTLTRLESLPARPVAGPLRAGAHLAVPMATGAFALLALAGPPTAPRLAFEQPPGHTLESAAVSTDGTWLVSLTSEVGGGRSLAGYRQKAVAPPAKSP